MTENPDTSTDDRIIHITRHRDVAARPPRRIAHHGAAPTTAPPRRIAGQATAEYALVLLGAAAVALMLAAWAARSGAIGDLFDAIVGQLLDRAT